MSLVSNRVTFSVKDLECEKLVVFQDRAEVRRLVKTSLKQGENEIILNCVSTSIDKDSVRVEGLGDATVLDVVCQSKCVQVNSTDTNEKLKNLNLEIEELKSNLKQTNFKLQRVLKQIQIVNEFANTISKTNQTDSKQDSGSITSKENIDSFLSFIDIYKSRLELFDLQVFDLEKEVAILEEKIRVAEKNRDRLSHNYYNEESIEIIILIETKKTTCDIDLRISYVVYNASWSPKYDIRVFANNKTMVINYFGLITQKTGEDWLDTKVNLSTAVPSIGGNVPELRTQHIRIKPQYRPKKQKSISMHIATKASRGHEEFTESEPNEEEVQFLSTNVNTSLIGSTSTFEIPRKSTIPSDSNTHKVSIGILNLNPEFEYETVPKLNAYAYLKAKVVNNSEYALLAGPANVFLDNNFVAKTNLKSYSPQEEFNCSLGIDPAIRIDYKPLTKFISQYGLLTKTTTNTYVQVIEIKNATQNAVRVLLHENLPLSNDDRIQVRLLEPVLKRGNNIELNKMNNFEFHLNIAANKTEEITVKYCVDHPSDKEIEFF